MDGARRTSTAGFRTLHALRVPLMTGVPLLSMSDALHLVAERFGLTVSGSTLPSDRDQNIMLQHADGRRFVLKIANRQETRGVLEAECAVFGLLASTGATPTVVPSREGDEIIERDGHFVRVITGMHGQPLGEVRLVTDALRRDIGRAFAEVDRTLATFDHPACHRHLDWDLAHAESVVAGGLETLGDDALVATIQHVLAQYRRDVVPRLPALRRGTIHGDGNDFNILVDVEGQVVSGLVDFGDMVWSHTVNEVAIAMAYVALGSDDPLAAAAAVVSGYHAVNPLTDDELAALFGLMSMRLCVSVCMAARQLAERPGEAYLGVSQPAVRVVLPQLAAIHPRFAHYAFREACGLVPVPQSPHVVQWLQAHRDEIAPLLGLDLATTPVAPLDFSAGSALIAGDPADNAPALLDARVRRELAAHAATVGVGGYREARLIYHWPNAPRTGEPRTIHIGLDLSTAAGTPLYAPLDGVVHGFENAEGHHDYGPVIVLRHRTTGASPVDFFTLYGHLTADSLDGLAIGQTIRRGTVFARIGSAPSNGDWWEHVHLQLIVDMLDVPCNVDGAVRASQRGVWSSLCPDPNLLLGIPATSLPHHDAPAEIAAARTAHIGRNLSVAYGAHALNIVRGWKQYLYDDRGHRFIDAYNNVAHVGHAHPRVVRAVASQLATLNTNTRYLQEQLTQYAEALTATLPSALNVCYFTASGSEANELALRLARARTGQRDLVVMDAAYHGHTTTLIDVSPYKHAGPGGRGAPDWVHVSPIPDVYRDARVEGAPGPWFAARVGEVVARIVASGRGVCGYIAETCPSVGGQIMPPEGFLRDVYAHVRAAGGVCIADEVQTGFGRIGTHFWAFQQQEVVPDIVVLGKPIANGYPMGAVITTRDIADAFDNGMEYFSTFGGSTAACVAALTTLQVTLEEQLPQRAREVGARLLDDLRGLQATFDVIGDVRGSGLFLGVEFVRSRATREPAARDAEFVVARMRQHGVLAGTDGPHHNVIKLRGPMCLSLEDADRIVGAMARALGERDRFEAPSLYERATGR
jgi:4-aminobutyrate aminotransferase-like enzyme/Ser/Thr protein kinase RdoA (MazF antagonist)/murein DD-endopeptidase MepM/ murein hydrolase activator NlpD